MDQLKLGKLGISAKRRGTMMSSAGRKSVMSSAGSPKKQGPQFKDPVTAAEEIDKVGKQNAANLAREAYRYLNQRYEQLRGRLDVASTVLEEVKEIPVEMF